MTELIGGLPYNSPDSIFISQQPPAGLVNEHAAVQQAFAELYNAIQQTIQVLVNRCGIGQQIQNLWPELVNLPVGLNQGNLRRFFIRASEPIIAGSVINIWSPDSVQLFAREALAADATKPADGICTTSTGIATGAIGEVQLSTTILSGGGVLAGARYWLSTTTPGAIVSTKPTVAGTIAQSVGLGLAGSVLYVNIDPTWIQN